MNSGVAPASMPLIIKNVVNGCLINGIFGSNERFTSKQGIVRIDVCRHLLIFSVPPDDPARSFPTVDCALLLEPPKLPARGFA